MYRLLIILSVCNAIDDDFGDYWYSNNDGVIEGGDFYEKIREHQNRLNSNKDDDIKNIQDSKTKRGLLSDSEIREQDNIREPDSNQVLDLVKKVFERRKCDSSNKQCAVEEFETGLKFLMRSLPILRIPSNLEVIFDGGEFIKDRIMNVLEHLSDDDKDLIKAILN